MPVTFAASTVPFLTTWKVAWAPSLMVLPALLNVSPRLWKKLPMSAEDCEALVAISARQSMVFKFAIFVVGRLVLGTERRVLQAPRCHSSSQTAGTSIWLHSERSRH